MMLLLMKIAAQKDNITAVGNIGTNHLHGLVGPIDIELAAHYFAEAIKLGDHSRKIDLDKIYDKTVKFKKENPNYEKTKIGKKEYCKEKMKVFL